MPRKLTKCKCKNDFSDPMIGKRFNCHMPVDSGIKKSSGTFFLKVFLPGCACLLHSPSSGVLSLILGLIIVAQAGGLPMQLGFMLLPKNAPAVTQGCKKGTCCTALCYVDKHGVHHCVHEHGDSCDCGQSTREADADQILISTPGTLPSTANCLPNLRPIGWVFHSFAFAASYRSATPFPPPK
jgi:hypothetical protein